MKLQVATTIRSGTGKLYSDQIRALFDEFRIAIDSYHPDDPWDITLEKWWRQGRTMLLLEEDDVVYAMLSFDKSEAADTAYISGLCVAERFRGQGRGRELLTETKRYLKSKGYLGATIGVDAANTVAFKLYESEGFEVAYYGLRCPF